MNEEGKIIYDTYRFTGHEFLRYGATGLLLGLLIVWLAYRQIRAIPLAIPVLLFFLKITATRLRDERRRTLQYHFRDFLTSLHTTMAAGYALETALPRAAKDCRNLYGKDDLLSRELRAIVTQMGYQRPVEELFRELGERSGVDDIRRFGELLQITKRTGGSMDRVLESTWRNLCEKIDTAKEIDALVAAKRYEQQIMSLMPVGIILYLNVGFSGFLDPLYGNALGAMIMTGCLGLYAAAYFWGRHMTRREGLV